jgi:hypothetical protein
MTVKPVPLTEYTSYVLIPELMVGLKVPFNCTNAPTPNAGAVEVVKVHLSGKLPPTISIQLTPVIVTDCWLNMIAETG